MLCKKWGNLLATQAANFTRTYCSGHAGVLGNEQENPLAEKASTQGMLRLDKADILKAVMNKFCGNEELEWKSNPYIHIKKELGVKVR